MPPPNWSLRYPDGKYTDEYPAPDLSNMERFMVWMHVAALPDFRKIWGRNDQDSLQVGRWRISIDMSKIYIHHDLYRVWIIMLFHRFRNHDLWRLKMDCFNHNITLGWP